MPILLLLSALVTVAFAQAPPGIAPRNLLDNPTAGRSLQGWTPFGDAVIASCDGDPCFVLRNRGSLRQSVALPADAGGKFLVIIGSGWTERLDARAITGLPSLYALVSQGARISAHFQGQQMLARPSATGEWVPLFGIFEVPAGGGTLRLQASLAEGLGVPQNGSAARFDDLGCYLFASSEEARAFVAAWKGSRGATANRQVTVPSGPQQAARNQPQQAARDQLLAKLRSDDVAWLEAVAGDDVTAERESPSSFSPGETRRRAYIRLGEMGTVEALAALERVRANARSWTTTPPVVPLSVWAHPAPHVGGSRPRPFVTIEAPDGTTYGLLTASLLGDTDLFLVSTRPGQEWSRPLLVPGPFYLGIDAPGLVWSGPGILTFTFIQREPPAPASIMSPRVVTPPRSGPPGPQTRTLHITAITTDSDGDGWTDLEEERLTLDPRNPDTDGDGLTDGADPSPNHSARADQEGEETTVVREALFATFGINRSRSLIHVESGPKPVQVWGFRGPVIYGVDTSRWRETHDLGYVQVSWNLVSISPSEAVVQVRDYEASLSAASYTVRLQRVGTMWVVVQHTLNWIS
jgi:hypothetical protein